MDQDIPQQNNEQDASAAAPTPSAAGPAAAAPQTATDAGPRLVETPADEAAILRQRLVERDQTCSEMETQMKRLAADFENFRRRQAIERENLIKFAGERILERFLEVLDNFERALVAGEKATEPQQVITGVSLIYRQLQDFLTKEGVAPLDAKGSPFDPNQHEAVVQVDVDDVPDQTVLEEFRKGYTLNGRVLRHAMVKVANNPSIPAISPLSPESAPSASADTSDEPAKTDSVQ
jgi:molecular chaperone GrpE